MKLFLDDVKNSTRSIYGNHSLSIDCPEELEIETYTGSLYQVFSNLIHNSVVHGFETLPNGQISITVVQHDKEIKITFKDNGIGMSEQVIKNAFEPFFTTKRGAGGSGLGLHLVYNYVTQLLGGNIQLSSKTNEGFTCVITLPSKG